MDATALGVPGAQEPAQPHRAVGFDADQWKYAFTNTYTDEESLAFYERYHIPASGRVLFDSVLANFKPGHQDAWVDFKNPKRAPLLFLSGSRGPHHAAGRAGVERQALQGQGHDHRARRRTRAART